MSNFQCLFWDAVSPNSRGLKQHKDDTEGGKQLFLKYRDRHPTCCPTLCPGYMQHLFPPNSVTVVYRPTQTCCVCAQKKGTLFGKWTIVHCMEGNNLCFVWADFFCCIRPPFPASSPEGGKDGWISDTCEMLNWSHQLGLSQQLKVTDPKTLCAVVSFFWNALWHQNPLFPIDLWGYEDYLSAERF